MSSNKKHWCVDCLRSWVRKYDYENHFSLQQVKENGKLVPNPCYNRKRKQSGILEDADNLKKNKVLNEFWFSGGASSSTVSDVDSVETSEIDTTEDRKVEEIYDSNRNTTIKPTT